MVPTLLLIITLLALVGCTTSVSGFAPVYPVQTFGGNPFNNNPADILNWVKVDSLQPTLRWKPFPGTTQPSPGFEMKPFVDVDETAVSDIVYDLKIWNVSNDAPAELVYEREGIAEPLHRLESPLKPKTKYVWSVRSRFKLLGKPRATEWSLSQIPCPPGYGTECARGLARRLGTIPPPNYYRFKTPR